MNIRITYANGETYYATDANKIEIDGNIVCKEQGHTPEQIFQFDQWKTSTGAKILLYDYFQGIGYRGTLEEPIADLEKDIIIAFDERGYAKAFDKIGFLKLARNKQEKW